MKNNMQQGYVFAPYIPAFVTDFYNPAEQEINKIKEKLQSILALDNDNDEQQHILRPGSNIESLWGNITIQT